MGYSPDELAASNEPYRIIYPLLLTIPVCLLGNLALMSVLAPIGEEYSFLSISNFFYGFLSNVCHQYPTRCLWILNRPMGLCSRCFSVYASLSICLLLLPLVRNRKLIILTTSLLIPLVADGLLQYVNLEASDNLRRVLTGVLFGAGASVIYKRSALTLLHGLRRTTEGSTVHHFHGNLDFAFSSGILLLTIFYSVVVYIV